MNRGVYLKTLRDLRGQTAAWSAGLAAIAALNVLLYPTLQGMPDLIVFLDRLPPAFKAMIGDVRELARLEGFLRVKLFEPLPLLLAIFTISQSAQAVAGEVEFKSMDLLLSRPVRRRSVVLAKTAALMTATLPMAFATFLSTWLCARAIDAPTSPALLAAATANGLPLAWILGGVALLGSCAALRTRSASLFAGALAVGAYVFETLRLLSPALEPWEWASLFAHQKAGVTVSGEVHAGPILVLLGGSVLLIAVAVFVFERRDC